MSFTKRIPPPGSRPGTLAIPPGSPPPRIRVFSYRGTTCHEAEIDEAEALRPHLDADETTWVDVQGFGDEEKLRDLADLFGLHPLTLEDATNVPQRAKSEPRPDHHLIIGRAPLVDDEGTIEVPQVCVILGPRWLLTFQERYYGFFDPVRRRIREGIGPIREQGPDYLAYALIDTLTDLYFPVVEDLSREIDELEERIHAESDMEVLADLHRVRRKLVVIRRVGWPLRETLRALSLERGPFIGSEVNDYFRSTEQHATQVMEAVDSARDSTTGLIEVHLSNLSQRTNEIMKVLTLMASIFIPLTFLAGIYGMNFEAMPELRSQWGYPAVLGSMGMVAVGMLYYFRKRGWIGGPRSDGKAED